MLVKEERSGKQSCGQRNGTRLPHDLQPGFAANLFEREKLRLARPVLVVVGIPQLDVAHALQREGSKRTELDAGKVASWRRAASVRMICSPEPADSAREAMSTSVPCQLFSKNFGVPT